MVLVAEFLTMESGGYPYGVNWSRPAESIADTELLEAINCEYAVEDGNLRTAAGIVPVLETDAAVTSLFWDDVNGRMYYSSGGKLYMTKDFASTTELGEPSGTDRPCYSMFGDTCLVASGGHLQVVSAEGALSEISGSPKVCSFVTVRCGRAVVCSMRDDALSYSSIGDATDWSESSNDTSKAQYVNIGYKEPGNIVALDFLAQAIMVYKEHGHAYKITGEPQDSNFSALSVSQTAFCAPRAAISVGNKSYYLGETGLKSFVPTSAYGDVEPYDEGINANGRLNGHVDASAALWRIPSRQQLWLKAQEDKRLYIYHYVPRYNDGRGAFTMRILQHDLHDVCDAGGTVYLAYGSKICHLDDGSATDDGAPIGMTLVSGKKLAQKHSILVMNRLLVVHDLIAGSGTLLCGKKKKPFSYGDEDEDAYHATMAAYDATGIAYNDAYTRSYRVGGGSNRYVQSILQTTSGAMSLRTFRYEYLEV